MPLARCDQFIEGVFGGLVAGVELDDASAQIDGGAGVVGASSASEVVVEPIEHLSEDRWGDQAVAQAPAVIAVAQQVEGALEELPCGVVVGRAGESTAKATVGAANH